MAPPPTTQEILDKILQLISRRADTYEIAVQTTICWNSDSGWRNSLTKLEFTRKGEKPPSEIRYEYRDVEIIRRRLTITQTSALLKVLIEEHSLETGAGPKLLPYDVSFSNFGNSPRRPYSEWLQWPAEIFEIQQPNSYGQTWPPDQPLIAVNAPHYPSFENVLFDLFGIRAQGWTNYLRGQIMLVLPDFRARISKLIVKSRYFRTDLECGFLRPSDLILQVYAENRVGRLVQETVQLKQPFAKVDVSSSPSLVSVALICKATGETLDQRVYRDGVSWLQQNVEVDLPSKTTETTPTDIGETLAFAVEGYTNNPRLSGGTTASPKSKRAKSKPTIVNKLPKEFQTAFNTYTVVRQVGCGGAGTVFEVRTSEGQTLALKLLDRSKTPHQKLKRFQNEIQFCLRPGSEYIVHVLDYGRASDGSLFYVMPYYPNTLRDLIKKGLSPKEVLPLFGKILDGVEAAHLLGVCHRDIKPENLLYDSDAGQIVLADFGIARFKEDDLLTTVNTGPRERLANFAYAAPEQRVPGQKVEQQADVYPLGLILNEMFTGQIPQGTGFRKIKEVAPEFGYLDDLVEMMLQQQSEQRIQSVTRVKQELIGRGNEFIRLQHLETLKKQVVPETELNDPILSDPIRAVEKEDYKNGVLTLKLNRPVNDKWQQCFRIRATAFSANVSAAMISFRGDRVLIRVNDHFVPQGVEFFKQYCTAANEEYAAQVKREHQQEIERRRAALRSQVQAEEARARILAKVQV